MRQEHALLSILFPPPPALALFCPFLFHLFLPAKGSCGLFTFLITTLLRVCLFLFLSLFSQLTLSLFPSYQLAWLPTFFFGERYFDS